MLVSFYVVGFLHLFFSTLVKRNGHFINKNVFLSNECKSETIDSGRSYVNEQVSIYNCFFRRLSEYSGSGGVISISGSYFTMKIELTMFYNCLCSTSGGAIYFSSENCTLYKVCAFRITSSSYYHFAYLEVAKTVTIDLLSLSTSSYSSIGDTSLGLRNGDQSFTHSNISYNMARVASTILTKAAGKILFSYFTLADNYVSCCICLQLSQSIGDVLYANIINNNSPSYGVVHLWSSGTYTMQYCIYFENQNTLLCADSGSMTLSNCFISHAFVILSGPVTTINNNTLLRTQSYAHQFYMSYYCNADNPVTEDSRKHTKVFYNFYHISFYLGFCFLE